MSLYRWRAVDETGDVTEGEMEAANPDQVVERLRRQGRLVLVARPVRRGALRFRFMRRGNRLRQAEAALMFREMATLLRAGLPLDRALDIMAQLAGESSGGRVMADLLGRVHGGSSLADAMEAQGESFPRFAIGMVKAGEMSGALEVVMARLADFTERTQELKEQVISAMLYPLLLFAVSLVAITLLLAVVLPQFKPLFDAAGTGLPMATRVVMQAGDFAAASWWLIPVVAVAALGLVVRRRSDPHFRLALDRRLLNAPGLGRLIADIEVGRLLRGLSTLLVNGVPLLPALSILGETTGNAGMAAAIDRACDSLRQGRGFAEPLSADPWFPKVAARLLGVGEETGRLDDTVARAADILDSRSRRAMERGLALLGPVMTLGVGLLVAGIITAILVAVLHVNDLVW